MQELKNRYNSTKHRDEKLESTFKLRFDNQIKANNRTGVVQLSEAVREIVRHPVQWRGKGKEIDAGQCWP